MSKSNKPTHTLLPADDSVPLIVESLHSLGSYELGLIMALWEGELPHKFT